MPGELLSHGFGRRAMRSGATRKGRDCTGKTWGCALAGAADAEFELYLVERRSDLLHCLADLRRIGLERAGPEVERLGFELDLRRVGRAVFRTLIGHVASDARAAPRFTAAFSARARLRGTPCRPARAGTRARYGCRGGSPPRPACRALADAARRRP